MGISSSISSIKKSIESIAFPAPTPSYTEDHENLIFVPALESKKVATMLYKVPNCKSIILYSHGNATDIGRMHRFLSSLSENLNTSIISYDYEGYGLTKGVPSEDGCYRSINAVYQYLIDIGYKPSNIVLYGVSIGSGPTVDLGMRVSNSGKQLKGVLLQAPYTSAAGVVSGCAETSFNCTGSCVDNPNIFISIGKVGQITCKFTIIHGKKDEIIAFSNSVALQKANNAIELIEIPDATHNNIERDHYVVLENCLKAMII